MAPPNDDPVNFDIIEDHKENIQALPSGRSARKLAELYAGGGGGPSPLQPRPSPSATRDANDAVRAEFEAELAAIQDADDPLDIYDRYVRWTLETYPSAQATKESGLHTLLERATRAFVTSAQYKNDPRYLRLWMQYIGWFSDAPREGFVFLSRHGIGEGLALFYEEYAAWLEGVGRWAQAEEVYKLGIEREARPVGRLVRKFGEFEKRREKHLAETGGEEGPRSPAIPPVVRKVLGEKVDPFAASSAPADPQAPRQPAGLGTGGGSSRPGSKAPKSKLAVFSDKDAEPKQPVVAAKGGAGWDSIGSLADRKKENTMEPKPWAGETLKAGGKKNVGPKLAVFRDPSLSKQLAKSHIPIYHHKVQVIVNPTTGKRERVFVDLRAVYPTPDEPGTELSFEEVWAANRGWLGHEWPDEVLPSSEEPAAAVGVFPDENAPPLGGSQKLTVHHDVIRLDENGAPIFPSKAESKPRKKKVFEINETQIIKAKLDSPTGPKIKKKRRSMAAEPTMTLHTKAATEDIYDIFNAPLKPGAAKGPVVSDDERVYESDDYTSGGESTVTNTQIADGDEVEDEVAEEEVDDDDDDEKSVASEWSEFSMHRVPGYERGEKTGDVGEHSDLIDMGGDDGQRHEEEEEPEYEPPRTRTTFIPIPPEDYVPIRRPYRDPAEVANNRLPFMTPITERTETSLADMTAEMSRYAKTPSRVRREDMLLEEDEEEEEEEVVDEEEEEEEEDEEEPQSPTRSPFKEPKPAVGLPFHPKPKPAPAAASLGARALAPKAPLAPKGPIIKELQCNPVDETIRAEILSNIHPPLSSYEGFYDHRHERFERSPEIRKFAKSVGKGGRSSTDKTAGLGGGVVLAFPEVKRRYTVRKELGSGAFGAVYLVENSHPDSGTSHEEAGGDENGPVAMMGRGAFASAHHRRHEREALKMEDPPSAWEFYMMRLAHGRLGPHHRATASLTTALEMHLYQDEGYLFLPYYQHGTLLDVVNLFRAEPSGVMDETLAMFFAIELLRTVEALHSKQIMHGDIKADNCLLRIPAASAAVNSDGTATTTLPGGPGAGVSSSLSAQYHPDGSGGWSARGITLIDFGRAIDMRAFPPDVKFVADWKPTAQDCPEMREGRPWTWQIDYHGLAGTLHVLLFGKYMETVRCDQGGLATSGVGGRRYRIRETLKRYWQTEIWGEAFDLLLNPGQFVSGEEGGKMPVLKGMKGVREKMERWLEGNCEKGVGLRALMARVEGWARGKR